MEDALEDFMLEGENGAAYEALSPGTRAKIGRRAVAVATQVVNAREG